MIKLLRIAFWLRFSCVVSVAWVAVGIVTPIQAQERENLRRNPAVATDGATLIHGNYCGAGNRPGTPPIDALDLACMNHDACSPTGGVPTCECNVRLRDEAAAVARDPRQAPELRSLASLTAAAATVMICNPTKVDAVVPPAAVSPVPAPPAASVAVNPPAPVPPAVVTTAPIADVAAPAAAPLSIVPRAAEPAAEAPDASVPVAPAESSPTSVEPRARSFP